MSLLETLEVREIAFRWFGTTRVYKCDGLRVTAEEDAEEITFSNGTKETVIQGVWLSYQIRSNYHQRVSPAGDVGNDWIDLLNAFKDAGVDVDFYPIYSIDNTLSVPVLLAPETRREMLSVNRSLFVPSINLTVNEQSRRSDYPDWLRTTQIT